MTQEKESHFLKKKGKLFMSGFMYLFNILTKADCEWLGIGRGTN